VNSTTTRTRTNKSSPTQTKRINIKVLLPDKPGHIIFWSAAIIILALDLYTKHIMFQWLATQPENRYSLIDGVVAFVTALNSGAAFGIADGRTKFLIFISSSAVIMILCGFLFSGSRQRIFQLCLGLFLAGVCGNLYDRIFNNGLVRDFVEVTYWPGRPPWPAFNIADSALVIGVILLLITTFFFTGKPGQEHAQQQK
jgi:signal peptidase II